MFIQIALQGSLQRKVMNIPNISISGLLRTCCSMY